MFKNILEWAKLNERERLSLLIGLVIVVLGWVIIKQHNDCMQMRNEYRNEKKELRNKLDEQKDEFLTYLREMDREYRLLLRELNDLKNEKNNS